MLDPKGATYGPTTWKDTLLDLAIEFRSDDSVTIQQTMVALRYLNPESFIENNINLLCRGHILRVPSLDQIRQIPPSQAFYEIQADNHRFARMKENHVLIDESQCELTEKAEIKQSDESNPDLTESPEVSSQSVESIEIERDNDTGDPEKQLPLAQIDEDKTVVLNEENSRKIQEIDWRIIAVNEETNVMVEAENDKEKEKGLINISVSIGLFAFVIISITTALLYVARRKSQARKDTDTITADEIKNISNRDKLSDFSNNSIEKDELTVPETPTSHQEATPLKQNYEIEKADIYIAYGKFQQAIDFLQKEINKAPDNPNLRLKLLEVYVETKDHLGFERQAAEIVAIGDETAIAEAGEKKKRLSNT